MTRLCTVCSHPDRDVIDCMLAERRYSYRAIASQFGLVHHSVQRHQENHLHPTLQQAQEKRAMNIAEYILKEMEYAQQKTREAMDHSSEAGDDRTVLAGAEVVGRNMDRLYRWANPDLQQAERERWAAEQTEQFRKRLEALRLSEPTSEEIA